MILASDQGATVSIDGAKTWSSWFNQPTGQFYHVATDNAFPYRLYGAQQDNGAAMIVSRSEHVGIQERDWRPITAGGESGSIAPDPRDTTSCTATPSCARTCAPRRRARCRPTTARPGVWRAEWTQPLAFGPDHALYTANQVVFRTRDGGAHWQTISRDLTRPHAGVPATLDPTTADDADGPEPRGVVYSLAPSPRARERRVGGHRRRPRAPHARRRPHVAQRHAARGHAVEPRRHGRGVAFRRSHRVRRGRPPPPRRRPPVHLRDARRRAHVARGGERDRRGQPRLGGARRPAAARAAVRRHGDRRLRVVRRRRGVAVAAAQHARRVRARHQRARRRSRDRDARPRVLDPRRRHAAAPARRRMRRRRARLFAPRARGAHAPVQRRGRVVAARSAAGREPAVRRARSTTSCPPANAVRSGS